MKVIIITDLIYAIAISTTGIVIIVRGFKEDARKTDTPTAKGEKGYSVGMLILVWIAVTIFSFCSIFFGGRSWFGS